MTKPIKIKNKTYEELKKVKGDSFSEKIDHLLDLYKQTVYSKEAPKPEIESIPLYLDEAEEDFLEKHRKAKDSQKPMLELNAVRQFGKSRMLELISRN